MKKKMPNTLLYAPQYVQVREEIRRRIEENIYSPGDKIPSETALLKEFGVSRITVINALRDLVAEGLLIRQRGRGSFVARRVSGKTKQAGVILRTQGDIFAEMTQALVGGLHDIHFLPTVFDSAAVSEHAAHYLECIERNGFDALIVEGNHILPFEALAELAKRIPHLVFLLRYETTLQIPGCVRILSDAAAGVRMILEHLHDQGHRRVLFINHEMDAGLPRIGCQMLRGAFETTDRMKDLKVDVELRPESSAPHEWMRIRNRLAAADRPTAVFASSDFRLKNIFSLATELGLRIPGDLALAGYGNTPWCDMLPVPLTSVDVNVRELAGQVSSALKNGSPRMGETLWIPPKLIVRASSRK